MPNDPIREEEGYRKSGVPLIVVVLLAIAANLVVLMVIWWLGAKAAEEGVDAVAQSLRRTVMDDTERQVYHFLQLPFRAMSQLRDAHRDGAFSMQRSDSFGLRPGPSGWVLRWLLSACQHAGPMSSLFVGNEYGHFALVSCPRENRSGPAVSVSTQPPIDQIRQGVPTWTIPCRYRADCAALYERRPAYQAFCEDAEDPWRGLEPCGGSQAGCRPYWADGRGTGARVCPASAAPEGPPYQCYADLRPPHATWAHALNPASTPAEAGSACRPDATGPRTPCSSFCPEVNRTWYTADDQLAFTDFNRTRSDYDPRSRSWYALGASADLPPGGGYTELFLCATGGVPCTSPVMPVYATLPAVGAVVVRGGRLAEVVAHVSTVESMHALQLRHSDGRGEIAAPQDVRLACTDPAPCRALHGTRYSDCEMQCAADAALPGGPLPAAGRQREARALVAVFGAAADTWSVVELIDSIKVGVTGGLFITERDERASLIAVSSSLPCKATQQAAPRDSVHVRTCFARYQYDTSGNVDISAAPERVGAYEAYAGPVVNGVMRAIFPQGSGLHSDVSEHVTAVASVGGEDFWVGVVPINPLSGPPGAPLGIAGVNWLLFVVLPQDDFLLPAEQTRRNTLVLSIVVGSVTSFVLVAVSLGLIVAPVKLLVGDFSEAQLMRTESIIARRPRWTPIREIAALQGSFRMLCYSLAEYRSFLPQSVLCSVAESVEDCIHPPEARSSRSSSESSEQTQASPLGALGETTASVGSVPSTVGSPRKGSSVLGLTRALSTTLDNPPVKRHVTVMVCNVQHLHTRATPASLHDSLHQLVLVVHGASAATKGNLDGVAGDRARCSWNAVRTQTGHRCRGALAAGHIHDSAAGAPPLSLAVCAGDAFCGNFGVRNALRYHAAVGGVISFAHAVERYARREARGARVALCEHRVKVEQPLAHWRWHSRVLYAKRAPDPVLLWELAMLRQETDDKPQEWMYAMADAEACTLFKEYNEAAEAAARGDRARACEILREVPDGSAQHMLATVLLLQLQSDPPVRCPVVEIQQLRDVGTTCLPAGACTLDEVLPVAARSRCSSATSSPRQRSSISSGANAVLPGGVALGCRVSSHVLPVSPVSPHMDHISTPRTGWDTVQTEPLDHGFERRAPSMPAA